MTRWGGDLCILDCFARIVDLPKQWWIFLDSSDSSAEVFLDDFKGFRARNYEIELMVHRIVERDESLKGVKKTNAP